MNDTYSRQHLSAETLQALLEGQLPAGEAGPAERHLAACARCSAEYEAFQVLFRELEELPSLAPSAGFSRRVMAKVVLAEPLSLAARIRGWAGVAAPSDHPSGEGLQDLVDGVLPARVAARMSAHLEGCHVCAHEAKALRGTVEALEGLGRFSPSEGFAARVMAQVTVPAPAPVRVADWKRAVGWLQGLVPQTRQAWAAVSGVALTPAVTLGLVLWTVFSHPTLTPGALVSFLGWKVTELAGVAWQAFSATALESAGLFKIYSMLGSLAGSPLTLAGLFTAMSVGTVAAVWVLYRNLIVHHPMDGRIAHAPLS